ncbi:hypothetical protein MN116_008888 [Schistosoma mekongi]|uniref:Uncharacterized protein n=1 Tax=Schistosoma mekongi TaxID=38744 RepID=A0AAE1Z5G7_SCHME|nr:hypothetical protein MN116_008888 [Schistosoma mekongi]
MISKCNFSVYHQCRTRNNCYFILNYKYEFLFPSKSYVLNEVNKLKDHYLTNPISNIVVCHNDLNAANAILAPDEKKIARKRKQYYNEILAVQLAKESLQNNDDDTEERIEKEDEYEEVKHNVEQALINARLNAELSRLSRNAEQPIDIISKIQNSSKSHY